MSAASTEYPRRLSIQSKVRRNGCLGRPEAEGLEDENAKLKKLLAKAMLDNAILKDVASKKW